MIRINLLPLDQRKSTFRSGLLYSLIIGTLLFLFGFIYIYQIVEVWALESGIKDMQQQNELNRSIQDKMLLANQKNQQIAGKEQIVNNLMKERSSWATLLSHLSAATLPEVWLTDITGEKNVLHIKGGAADYAYIAMFMQRLEQDPFLTDTTLVNAARDSKLPATTFEITVKLKGL